MNWTGFNQTDFQVFSIPGLTPRMEALKKHIRPKLETLGENICPYLSELTEKDMYVHVAKHARRTVNPPDETWVAWSPEKRGYKAHPHFQVGIREDHVFAMFALIYECPHKPRFAQNLSQQIDELLPGIPSSFVISQDHTRPEVTSLEELGQPGLEKILERLEQIKKAEFLCGVQIQRQDPILQQPENLEHKIMETFQILTPLYRLAVLSE